jgi:hypothetical protein
MACVRLLQRQFHRTSCCHEFPKGTRLDLVVRNAETKEPGAPGSFHLKHLDLW